MFHGHLAGKVAVASIAGLVLTFEALQAATDPTVRVALIVAISSMVVAFLGAAASITTSLINRARMGAKLDEVKKVTSDTNAKVVEVGKNVDGRVTELKASWDQRFEAEKSKLIAEIGKAQAEGELKGGDKARVEARSDAADVRAAAAPALPVPPAAEIPIERITTAVIEAGTIVTKDPAPKG